MCIYNGIFSQGRYIKYGELANLETDKLIRRSIKTRKKIIKFITLNLFIINSWAIFVFALLCFLFFPI